MGAVGPLLLGLHAEVAAQLAERDLHLPALDEPADDLQQLLRRVGDNRACGSKRRRGSRSSAQRSGTAAGVVPNGGARADLHHPVALAVPARNDHALPGRRPVGQYRREVRQARP